MPARPPDKRDVKSGKKRKAKTQKIARFTKEELDEEIDTFLTCYNPYMSQNCVEFDLKTQSFKPILSHRKPVFFAKNIGASKKRLTGDYGVFYEEVERVPREEKMRNKFNFRSVATQTDMENPKDQCAFVDPNLYPVLRFKGSASKSEIIAAYLANEEKKEEQRRKEEKQEKETTKEEENPESKDSKDDEEEHTKSDAIHLPTLLKRVGRKQTELENQSRGCLRLCERMVEQNLSEAHLDFSYYDNPNDEYAPTSGSLLPLWRLGFRLTALMPVTGIAWNAFYVDLFAAGFSSTPARGEEAEDEDDLGVVRESGYVCVFSLKGPGHPERVFPCARGVRGVAFHPSLPHLLAAALSGGSVAVFDLRVKVGVARDSKFEEGHHVDSVEEIEWLQDELPQKFTTVSSDGKIMTWLYSLNDLFAADLVTSLRLKDWPLDPPPKGLEMDLEPSTVTGEHLGLNARALCLSLNRSDPDGFALGDESGVVHRGSVAGRRLLAAHRGHQDRVRKVRWNALHPRVLITCSDDYTARVWDAEQCQSVFEFFFEGTVRDVAWAPFSSTLFAVLSGHAVVSVFDLSSNKTDPIGGYSCYSPKEGIELTKIVFHPTKPILMVGDEVGNILLFKLSPNLRSSLKALETLEKKKFLAGEIDKMEKLLITAKM